MNLVERSRLWICLSCLGLPTNRIGHLVFHWVLRQLESLHLRVNGGHSDFTKSQPIPMVRFNLNEWLIRLIYGFSKNPIPAPHRIWSSAPNFLLAGSLLLSLPSFSPSTLLLWLSFRLTCTSFATARSPSLRFHAHSSAPLSLSLTVPPPRSPLASALLQGFSWCSVASYMHCFHAWSS